MHRGEEQVRKSIFLPSFGGNRQKLRILGKPHCETEVERGATRVDRASVVAEALRCLVNWRWRRVWVVHRPCVQGRLGIIRISGGYLPVGVLSGRLLVVMRRRLRVRRVRSQLL